MVSHPTAKGRYHGSILEYPNDDRQIHSGLRMIVRVGSAVAHTDLWLSVHPGLQRTGRVRAVMEHIAAAVARAAILEPHP
jgi:hypothetical protein